MQKIRALRSQLKQLAEQVAAVRKLYTQERNAFKHDTGIELQILDSVLKRSELSKGDMVKYAVDFHWMSEMEGLPVGGQMSLIDAFENTPAEVKDELDYEADGYRAGVRGDDPSPPDYVPPRFHTNWVKGWHNGQARNAWAIGAASLAEPAPLPDDADDDNSDRDDDDEEDIEERARRLAAGDDVED